MIQSSQLRLIRIISSRDHRLKGSFVVSSRLTAILRSIMIQLEVGNQVYPGVDQARYREKLSPTFSLSPPPSLSLSLVLCYYVPDTVFTCVHTYGVHLDNVVHFPILDGKQREQKRARAIQRWRNSPLRYNQQRDQSDLRETPDWNERECLQRYDMIERSEVARSTVQVAADSGRSENLKTSLSQLLW